MNFSRIKYVFISVLFICFTNISYGQTYPVYKKLSAIAVLDQDSLFSESEWGKNVLKNVENQVLKLSNENIVIQTALELEEAKLTKIRKTNTKIEFKRLYLIFFQKYELSLMQTSHKFILSFKNVFICIQLRLMNSLNSQGRAG